VKYTTENGYDETPKNKQTKFPTFDTRWAVKPSNRDGPPKEKPDRWLCDMCLDINTSHHLQVKSPGCTAFLLPILLW
jgi:hypothetical protein